MAIKIDVTQTCDRCGKTRNLEIDPYYHGHLTSELTRIAYERNWKGIEEKHLCPECVDEIFSKSTSRKDKS